MTTTKTTFKRSVQAIVLATSLLAGLGAAAPSAIAAEPAFNFRIDLGTGAGGIIQTQDRRPGGWDDRNRRQACMADRDIVRSLARTGYRNVQIRRDLGRNRVEAVGMQGRWSYSMQVDRCTGRVDRVQRLQNREWRPQPGFGLQFNFGN